MTSIRKFKPNYLGLNQKVPGRKRCEAPQVTWYKKVTWSGTSPLNL